MTTKHHPFSIAALFAIFLVFAPPLEAEGFNPNAAQSFLKTMTTLNIEEPDVNILLKLFKARKTVGLDNHFVESVERCVCAGVIAAGRADVYYNQLKAECENKTVSEFEATRTLRCPDCKNGISTEVCRSCNGTGKCHLCGGRGRSGAIKCAECNHTGRCWRCKGSGKIKEYCSKCGGTSRVWERYAALEQYIHLAGTIRISLRWEVMDRKEKETLAERERKEQEERAKREQTGHTRKEQKERARKEQAEHERRVQEVRARKEQFERERREQEERARKEQAERERREQEEKARKEQAERERKEQEERARKEQAERERKVQTYGFDPDEALNFFKVLTTLDLKKPDIAILMRLFEARESVCLGNRFLLGVERCVCAGAIAAGCHDVYYNRLKAECKKIDVYDSGFEAKLSRRCPDCTGGSSKNDCFQCKGSGRIWDMEAALQTYADLVSGLMYVLCRTAEDTKVPEKIRQEFAIERNAAESKFRILRELREQLEAKAEAERKRKEQAEKERKEREERAEKERREREERAEKERREREEREAFVKEQRAKGNVSDIVVKCNFSVDECSVFLGYDSGKLERAFIEVVDADCELTRAEVELSKAKAIAAIAGVSGSGIKESGNVYAAQMALMAPQIHRASAVNAFLTECMNFVEDSSTICSYFSADGSCKFADIPRGIGFLICFTAKHNSRKLYCVRPITLGDSAEEIVFSGVGCIRIE